MGDDEEIEIRLRVPKAAFVMVAGPPATVTQKNVTVHFGISARAYLEALRAGHVPFKKLGKLRVASYDDVRRFLTEGTEIRTTVERASGQPRKGTRYFDRYTQAVAGWSKTTPC